MSGQRILITSLSSHTGGRLAQALERQSGVESVVGIDTEDPRHELQRTEFVRVDTDRILLRRIITAAAIDTVIDTRLISDPLAAQRGRSTEVNVVGTQNLLDACAGAASPVRRIVFKSSAQLYGCEQDDPAFFGEEMERTRSPRSAIEREIAEAEAALEEFAADHPAVTVTSLRCAEEIGAEVRGSHLALLNLPVIPSILGFDPRWQFVHHDDVIGALAHAARRDLPGTYNVAADGVLALSEVASLLGKPLLPVLPPWGTVFAAAQLRRLGLPVPVELLRRLRFGRGIDNRRIKAGGYAFRYTTREAVLKLRAQQRLRPLLGSGGESYRYEREVEEFLRWSPSVHSAEHEATGARPQSAPAAGRDRDPGDPPEHPAHEPAARTDAARNELFDDLSNGELIELISSLDANALERLRVFEAAHRRRRDILDALDQNLARRATAGRD